jgi:hypothetical protein
MCELLAFKSVSQIRHSEHFLDLMRRSFDIHPIGSPLVKRYDTIAYTLEERSQIAYENMTTIKCR